jgi:hypothetical protein
MRSMRLGAIAGAVLWVVAVGGPALAVTIDYGSHVGATVTYVGVSESNSGMLPLYGAPVVTGDSLDFNPLGFDASSADGGSEITDGNLGLMVVAQAGSRIESIRLGELGDTTLAGNVAPGSMATATAVFASGVLDIHEVDFAGINHISVPFSLTFSPSGGTFFLGTDGGGGPIFNTQFSGSVTLDIEAILIANAIVFTGGATKVSLNLDNTLTAVSETGTSALIAKKDFGLVTTTIAVPEPASLVLAGLAFAALARRRHRR